jgi:hypothetical protein
VSPRSRGRPPGRGRRRHPGSRLNASPSRPGDLSARAGYDAAECWFEDPAAGDRQSWTAPPGHGTYRGLDLELLDVGDDDDLLFLIEALHDHCRDAPGTDHELTAQGEPANPRLHVTMHQIVARQILAGDPPQTWQTVQRLAEMGYDWHAIMHMIAGLVAEDVYAAMADHRQPDPADYVRRLHHLPAGWPAPGDALQHN